MCPPLGREVQQAGMYDLDNVNGERVTRVMSIIILCLKNGIVFKVLVQGCFWMRVLIYWVVIVPFITSLFSASLCHVVVYLSALFFFFLKSLFETV